MILLSIISSTAIKLIQPGMTLSLGGGSNVATLAQELKASDLASTIKLYSPSELTLRLGQSMGLIIKPIPQATIIDLAFDGCDSVDSQLNALKSGGGIHLFEKIAAQKAKDYYLLAPKNKISPKLNPQIPLCLEVVEPCLDLVLQQVNNLGLSAQIRQDQTVAALARTPLGNLLVDVTANDWDNIIEIEHSLISLNGVISSSLFTNLVTGVISEDHGTGIIFKGGTNYEQI